MRSHGTACLPMRCFHVATAFSLGLAVKRLNLLVESQSQPFTFCPAVDDPEAQDQINSHIQRPLLEASGFFLLVGVRRETWLFINCQHLSWVGEGCRKAQLLALFGCWGLVLSGGKFCTLQCGALLACMITRWNVSADHQIMIERPNRVFYAPWPNPSASRMKRYKTPVSKSYQIISRPAAWFPGSLK